MMKIDFKGFLGIPALLAVSALAVLTGAAFLAFLLGVGPSRIAESTLLLLLSLGVLATFRPAMPAGRADRWGA